MASEIGKVGIVGIGLMGSGIAQVAAARNFTVVVIDVSTEIVGQGMERLRDSVKRAVDRYRKTSGQSGIAPDQEEKIVARIKPSTDRRDLLACDIVIEAVSEDETAKKQLVTALAALGYDKLLVSNTSSISITRLASAYSAPEKFMGMHFCVLGARYSEPSFACGSAALGHVRFLRPKRYLGSEIFQVIGIRAKNYLTTTLS